MKRRRCFWFMQAAAWMCVSTWETGTASSWDAQIPSQGGQQTPQVSRFCGEQGSAQQVNTTSGHNFAKGMAGSTFPFTGAMLLPQT